MAPPPPPPFIPSVGMLSIFSALAAPPLPPKPNPAPPPPAILSLKTVPPEAFDIQSKVCDNVSLNGLHNDCIDPLLLPASD